MSLSFLTRMELTIATLGVQVTEEDIALCMGELENPLPEVDQEEHPLRVLSQENLTVVSTFTGEFARWPHLKRYKKLLQCKRVLFINSTISVSDSMSVTNDLDRLFPRSRWCLNNSRSQPPMASSFNNARLSDKGKLIFSFILVIGGNTCSD